MNAYRLSVWYRATSDTEAPQTHEMTAEQVEQFIRPEVGFLHDMLELKGEGVRKLALEVIQDK